MRKVIGSLIEVSGEVVVKKKKMKNIFKYREIEGPSEKRIYLEVISLEKKKSFKVDFIRPKDYWSKPIFNRRITNKGDIVETNVISFEKFIKINQEILRIPMQWEIDRYESLHFPETDNAKLYKSVKEIVEFYNKNDF